MNKRKSNHDRNSHIAPYIVMSLKDQWYQEILAGKKKFEYRRQFLKEPCTAFVYVTVPVGAICALIKFGKPRLRQSGYAIPIKSIKKIPALPLSRLTKLKPAFFPPQSYYYLDRKPALMKLLLSYV